MRGVVGLALIAIGVLMVNHACTVAPDHALFLMGMVSLGLGWWQLPSEAELQARVQRANRLVSRPGPGSF